MHRVYVCICVRVAGEVLFCRLPTWRLEAPQVILQEEIEPAAASRSPRPQ